jgi:triacylglycerol esterase/lipase EstA (alpha/beta hydrolase family)
LVAAFAPAALAQPSIPDLPGDVDDRVPDDVTNRVPGGNEDDADDEDRGGPDLPEVSPEDLAPGLPVPDEVGPQAVLEPARPNPFVPSPGTPMGSNDYQCVPTAARPNPVVLVHGTFEDRNFSWSFVSPMLKDMGYCVYAINYGNNGTIPIEESAVELSDFVDDVLAAPGTVQARQNGVDGADKVSIVAHSQGGLMSRVYLKEEGGLGKVEDLVSLAASNHGTDNELARPAEASGCESCVQQFPYERSPRGNDFTEEVNAGDETPGDISYTQINTRFDDVVFPYFSAFLAESGSRNGPRTTELNGSETTNFCLQDQFPADTTDHVGTQYDPFTFQVIVDALANDGPADEPDRPDSVCAPTAERGGSGGDDDRGGNGNRGGNGGGGGGNGSGDGNGLGFVLTPAFLDAMARHECSPRFFNQNFGPAGGPPTRAFFGCVTAASLSLRQNVAAEQSCARPALSRKRAAGERRSDYAACVIAVRRVVGARNRIASLFTF